MIIAPEQDMPLSQLTPQLILIPSRIYLTD